MAMELIDYPDPDSPDLEEWRTMIQDLEVFTGGLLFLSVENINTTGVPRILENSRLDINGSKYVCISAETITGSPTPSAQNYVYAVPNGNTASFIYSNLEPSWNPAKGGWYREFSGQFCRAIINFFFVSGNLYLNKIILDSFDAMNNPLIRVPDMMKGFLQLKIYQVSMSKPEIEAGSLIEVDGVLYNIASRTEISGSPSSQGDFFIIARPSNGSLSFVMTNNFSTINGAINWNGAKNGWYHSGSEYSGRVIGRIFYRGGSYPYDLFRLVSEYSSMFIVENYPAKESGAYTNTSLVNTSTPGEGSILLQPGRYYYEIRSADSGNIYDNSGNIYTPEGYMKIANAGAAESGVFYFPGGRLRYWVGQKGGNAPARRSNIGGAGEGGSSRVGWIEVLGGNRTPVRYDDGSNYGTDEFPDNSVSRNVNSRAGERAHGWRGGDGGLSINANGTYGEIGGRAGAATGNAYVRLYRVG